jgi:uncharacterized protein
VPKADAGRPPTNRSMPANATSGTLRDATTGDYLAVVQLNALSVHYLSPMDERRLVRLANASCYFRVIDIENRVAAFLLGFRKGGDYDSPNFLWFEQRAGDFVYIDRIVVAEAFRGQHLAARLYTDIERYAAVQGVGRLTAEIDILPLNSPSLHFHDRRGFLEIGQAPYGTKLVSLREKHLSR